MKKSNVLKTIVLSLLAFCYLIPFWMLIVGSLKTQGEAMYFSLDLPKIAQWSNYSYVIEKGKVFRGYGNSIIMSFSATALTLLVGSWSGIHIGRSNSRLADGLYHYFLLGITLTFQTASMFALLQALHIYGTRMAIILIWVSLRIPFTVMTFSGFMKGIPREIDEAAVIDGSGTLSLIFKILLPIMKPIFMTNLIITLITTWNNFMIPLFYLNSSAKMPVTLLVYNFYGMENRNWHYVFAMLALTALPVILIYLCLQKYIVAGMTAGSVKG